MIASVAGGLSSGLIAALLSSLALPFLYGAPRFRLRLNGTEEVVTAVVFLAVAMVVGLLVGGASEERARASRREREARLLGYLSTKLLTGELPDRVLDDFATVLLEPFGLARCEITVELAGSQLHAVASGPDVTSGGPDAVVPLVVGTVAFGTLKVERPLGKRPFTPDELELLEAAAKQAAAALDRARLDVRARSAQLEAETNQLRAAMFSSVTHDLRTPLASIKAGVTSLLDPTVQVRTRAGDRAAHHDPGGDRPPQPPGGQHPRPGQDPRGGVDPEPQGRLARRIGGDGDRPHAAAHGPGHPQALDP